MAGKTVVVGCKLPHGLRIEIPGKGSYDLKGANSSTIMHPGTGRPVQGTCGYTPNVDEDFAKEWLKLYRDTPMVKKELIFIQNTLASAQAQGKEMADETTGFEQIDPTKKLLDGVEANPDAPKPEGTAAEE